VLERERLLDEEVVVVDLQAHNVKTTRYKDRLANSFMHRVFIVLIHYGLNQIPREAQIMLLLI